MLKVIKNAAYLIFIQGLGYLSPLLVSYLIIDRSGIEAFGQYSIYFSIALYCQVLFDMGHQFTATRRIAGAVENRAYISSVYWNAYAVKALVLVLGLLLATAIASVSAIEFEKLLAAVGYGAAAASLPIWFFHGTDRFRHVALLVFVSRALSLLLIYFLYDNADSITTVLWHQSWPNIVLALAILCVLLRSEKLTSLGQVTVNIREEFRGTLHVMSSSLGGSAMANMPVLVLGILKDDFLAGVYAGADRLIKVLASALLPISQAAFPANSAQFAESAAAGVRSVLKLGSLLLIAFVIMLGAVWAFGDFYFRYFQLPDESRLVFVILLGWLFWGVLNNIVGIQGLLAAGHGKVYNLAVWMAVLVTLTLLITLIPRFGVVGTSFAIMLGEASMFFVMLSYVAWLMIKRRRGGKIS
ncbi:oligosaccharide flippase family protein [Vreelandella rituensis]|uniref:oligosaccharide flippase family protein n=1 Tax=Vreelandella rituensis TaxID=2282306 RepID=UPI0015F00089|nr:oligosaccharide flippase family protein [Halomonas rituensis]